MVGGSAERRLRAITAAAMITHMTDAYNPTSSTRSPRIIRLEWGLMEMEGIAPGKDFVLYPGGGHAWDWAKHGTRHSPGIQPGDVQELLERGVEVLVLSLGMERRLQIAPPTLELIREAGVEMHVDETRAAGDLYNTLTAGPRPVGGLFHSTC
ncbi:MTH938/NDUFAF3 family protein [Streptomyces sp. NPDC091371]|uniref:MTH938/NDUFAF3 family protein n=1 Tax=Streptomyces sp. NPDC091371 TaxID=3155303 RepID=UPI003436BBF5